MIDQKIIEFFNYIQPIVNGCSGFIKTEGYITHSPGLILMMDPEETYFVVIHIPIIYDIYITTKINTLLSIKNPEDMNLDNLYVLGWNIKAQKLANYYSNYNDINLKYNCIYYEPDCYNIPLFENKASNTSIGLVNIKDSSAYYQIPVSKAITQLAKSDTVSLQIYNCTFNPPFIKTVKYSMYKKKFKLTVDIYSNIIVS